MKSNRIAVSALLIGVSMLSLTGCFGSSRVTSPTGGVVNQTAPAAPTNVRSSYDAVGNRDYLNWDASASANVASYDVFVYDGYPSPGATATLVSSVNVSQNFLPLPIVSTSVQQFYSVRANGNNGLASAFSNSGSVVRHPWVGPTGGPAGGPQGKPFDPLGE